MAPSITFSVPNRRASRGANGAKTPSSVTGAVVSTVTAHPGRPAAAVISGRIAEKLEKTVRRFRPTRTTHTAR
jgi:hypothetical protein